MFKLTYDAEKDLAPVSEIAIASLILVVHPSLPVRSLTELIKLAKAQPGALNYGSGGIGSPLHLAGELFNQNAGVSIVHIPFKGAAPAIADLLGGQISTVLTDLATAQVHIKSGKLRSLAINGPARSPLLPEVPTFTEQGFAEAEVMSWYTIAVRAGTPAEIVDRIHAAAMKIIALPETRERLDKASCEVPAARPPRDVQALYAADYARYGKLVKEAGIKRDG